MKGTTITKEFAANVRYGGFTHNNIILTVVFKHIGEYYFTKTKKSKHILSGIDSAIEKHKQGKKVYHSSGYFDVCRFAIPTTNASGEKDIWYINNHGDSYEILKVSKYAKKIYSELAKEVITVAKF